MSRSTQVALDEGLGRDGRKEMELCGDLPKRGDMIDKYFVGGSQVRTT